MSNSQRRRNRRPQQSNNDLPPPAADRDTNSLGLTEAAVADDTDVEMMTDQRRAWLSRMAWQHTFDDLVAWARRPEAIVLIAIVLIAGLLRFWDLGERAVHHDESLHGYYSWYMSTGGGFNHNPLLHGTVQFIATSFVFRLFGASDMTLRLLPALLGTIVVALPYLLFRHKMGTWGH